MKLATSLVVNMIEALEAQLEALVVSAHRPSTLSAKLLEVKDNLAFARYQLSLIHEDLKERQ